MYKWEWNEHLWQFILYYKRFTYRSALRSFNLITMKNVNTDYRQQCTLYKKKKISVNTENKIKYHNLPNLLAKK